MALPLLYFIVYKYIPMFGTIIAFKNYYPTLGFIESDWVGLKNFKRLFQSHYFPIIVRNTLIISSLKLLFFFPTPIILALLLNEVPHQGFKRITQTISYLPHFISWVAIAGLMKEMLSPTTGLINRLIVSLGGEAIFFLGAPSLFRTIIVASSIWQGVGWGAIIYLAAISGINPQIYEASTIDGANRWQQTFRITIPSIMPIVVIFLVLRIGHIMNEDFEQIFNLYSPATYEVGDVFETYIYREGILGGKYSFATTVGLFKGFIGLILVWITNKIAQYFGQEGVW